MVNEFTDGFGDGGFEHVFEHPATPMSRRIQASNRQRENPILKILSGLVRICHFVELTLYGKESSFISPQGEFHRLVKFY